MFYKVAVDIELANTKALLVGEIQGYGPVSLQLHIHHDLGLCVLLLADALFNIHSQFSNTAPTA